MDGLTTGSTLLDAVLIALIPVLTLILQRLGLSWLFDKKKKAETPPDKAEVSKEAPALKDTDLEEVTGGKNRLARTLDNFDATVRDIGRAARHGDEAFKNFNGMFRK